LITVPEAFEYPEMYVELGDEAVHENVAGGFVTLDTSVIPTGCPEQMVFEVVVFVT
jgi:hypothetical protein